MWDAKRLSKSTFEHVVSHSLVAKSSRAEISKVHLESQRYILKLARKHGENRILDEVSPVATFRLRTIDKLDEACTNADDQMMLVQHRSGDR